MVNTMIDNSEDNNPEMMIELLQQMKDQNSIHHEKLGLAVARLRDDSVKARKRSGIEVVWKEDNDYYNGIDDFNRSSTVFSKSPSPDGGMTSRVAKNVTGRCTAFFNMIGQFCDAAEARIGDIILPSGDWNFALRATPVPEATASIGSQDISSDGRTMGEVSSELLAGISEKADKAESKIRDWLIECQYHTQSRMVISDAIRIGTGVMKGPVPLFTKKQMARKTPEGNYEIVVEESTQPASYRIDPWNFFPDPDCGDDIHRGAYVLERDFMSATRLRDLKKLPGYLSEAIDKVIAEGPGKRHSDDSYQQQRKNNKDNESSLFEIWYFYGTIEPDVMEATWAYGGIKDSLDSNNGEPVHAIITLVNDTVIRATCNPLDTGEFPYDVVPWQAVSDSWAGIGVARKGRIPQEMVNAGARALMTNAGLGAMPITIYNRRAIRPADGSWAMTPGKIFEATGEIGDVRSAINFVDVPMHQLELTNIIQLGQKMMEDSTGIFFLMQGQQGSAPDTVGGMQLLHNNSSALLRRFARVFDEKLTEPHIRRYYSVLMSDPNVPYDCKGDFDIQAIGSTALVEKSIQDTEMVNLLQLSVNPVFGIDPTKAMSEFLKTRNFSPYKFQLDDAKRQEIASQPPPVDPRVQAAQIIADANVKRAEIDSDRDTVYNQSLKERDTIMAQTRMAELQTKKEIAMLEYANKNQINLDQIKSRLADSAMKLRTQRELSLLGHKVGLASKPPTEPIQHAENGRSYEQ